MKAKLIFFTLLSVFFVKGQLSNIPDSINYQAVLRDAAGNILAPGTSGTLNFKIFPDLLTNTAVYEENHNFTTNAAGLVNLFIGGGVKVGANTFANVNWGSGSVCYEVALNGTTIGSRQIFGAVPYAIYAKTSGSALPLGLQNQTLYYDAGTGGWKATNGLTHDGNRTGIGLQPSSRVKLHVLTTDPNDSAAVYANKVNANNNDAGFRSFVSGSTNTTQLNPIIYGGEYRANDNGNGFGIGASGLANAGALGTAIGLSGQARGPITSTIIGIYASVDTLNNNPNAYAAVFDKGKVVIGGSVYFPNASVPPGSIYKIDAAKRGYWAPSGTSTVSINQGGIVTVNPNGPGTNFTVSALAPTFSSTGLGTITMAAYPNYIFNLPTPSFSFNSGSGLLTFNQGTFNTTTNLSPSLSLTTPNILNIAGNSLTIPALNFWAKPTATAVELGNINDYVGIGTTSPSEKLVVQTGANSDISIVGTFGNKMTLNFGTTTNHFLGAVKYNSTNDNLSFSTAGIADRLVISGSGNVGIANLTPTQKLDVVGNIVIPASNDYLYAGPKTQYLSVPSAAFTSENSDTYDKKFISGHLYAVPASSTVVCPPGTATYFEAPVQLPQGATVTAVDAYVVDGDANYDISLVQLWRVNSPTGSPFGTPLTMATTPASTGSNANIQVLNDNTIVNAVIDNQNFYYFIRFGGSYTGASAQNIRLARVVVTYNVSKAD